MSLAGQYPVRAFSESQTFLVFNPSTQQVERVLGSDLVGYITPNLDSVRGNTTRSAAQNEDYPIGTFVQTAGGSAINDGGNGMFLVVEGGDGDYAMMNGNDLLLLPFGSLAGSNLDGALVTDDAVQVEIEDAIALRPVQYGSMEAVRLSTTSHDYIETSAFYAGGTTGAAKLYRDGTGTPTGSGAAVIAAALSAGTFCNAAGVCYKLRIDQRITPFLFGAKGDYNGSTGNDDTDHIQAMFDFASDSMDAPSIAYPVFFEPGIYKISARVDVPPAVHIFGAGIYNGTQVVAGSGIWLTHDGVGFRFTRNSAGTTLYHNGAMRYVWFTGNGSSDTTATKLVELGNSDSVDTSHGAWNGIIENCAFNNTYGYGIYSAHSQSWKISKNFFRNTRYGIWYNTVAASAVIEANEFALTNASLNAYGIVLLRGSLGGATGAIVQDNYMISPKVGIWMSNQIGAIVENNTIEGANDEAIMLTRNVPSGSADVSESGMLNGCKSCHIDKNTFINWNAGGGSKYAIQIAYSRNNYIGHQGYISPNASSPGCIGLTTDGTDPTEDNIVIQPLVDGNNAGTVPGWLASDTQWYYQMMIRQDGIKLGLNGFSGTRGASDRGHMFFDSNNCVRYYTGTEAHYFLIADDTLAGSAGAAGQFARININGTFYKLQLYADA